MPTCKPAQSQPAADHVDAVAPKWRRQQQARQGLSTLAEDIRIEAEALGLTLAERYLSPRHVLPADRRLRRILADLAALGVELNVHGEDE